ncbi:MAG: alginate lyase family protein [Chromatiales bacterium]|nr:MAG: alginate lyase family protein [Chromatiales bacterium]
MQSLDWYINRLRSMGPREILWRVRGLAAAQADLVRIPAGLVPKLKVRDALSLEAFSPGFRCSPAIDAAGEVASGARRPEWDTKLLRVADHVLEDKLSYFDLEEQFLGDPVDWQRDWSSGKAIEMKLSHLVDYRVFDAAGDCKLVWEPNRHHQLVVLARAYRVTGETRYARKIVDILMDWLDQNPFGYGMNWKSGLELGVRLINWVWAIDLIRDADVFEDHEWEAVLRAAYLAMWDTQRRYSQGSSANNHLVGEVAGVLVASCYFKDFPNASRWRAAAMSIMEHELYAQSFPDGCTREHAFGYQFFVLQFYGLSMLACERFGTPLSGAYTERLHEMYRFMAEICADTGEQPHFGDADDGYVLDLGNRPTEQAELISVGAALFGDDALALSDASESAWWITGEQVTAKAATPAASKPFRGSGYFVLRSGVTAPPVRVFFDCAELGFGAIAAHGHADCLSFSLALHGHEVLVDPGTYDYYTYPEWRNYFRSTLAHNTVEIDGQSQSELQGAFMWGHRANATLVDWQEDDLSVVVSGEHDGYAKLEDPVVHRRSLTLHKETGDVSILDQLHCSGQHQACVSFHVAPGYEVTAEDDDIVITGDRGRLRLRSPEGCFEIVAAADGIKTGWVSSGYHRKARGHALFLRVMVNGDTEIRTSIVVEEAP